jgi:hypothetical protein
MLGVGGLVIYAVGLNVDRMITGRTTYWRKDAKVVAVAGICSMLLVSVQLVPFLEFTRNAVGLNIPYDKMRDIYLSPPALLLRSLIPDLFGNPVAATEWSGLLRDTVHPYNPDFIVYCGTGCALVALGGLAFARKIRRMRAFILLFLVSVGLAMSPIMLRTAYALLPVFRYSRVARVSVLGVFALAALAGLTISRLTRNGEGLSRRLFVRIVLASLVVFIVAGLLFSMLGHSYIERAAVRARALGEDFWRSALAQIRSGKLREWAEGGTAQWFAYTRNKVGLAMLLAALSSVAVIVLAWPFRLGRRVRQAALAGFFIVLLLDLGIASRAYLVTQPSADLPEVEGITLLKHVLGDPGRWRTRSVSYDPEYVSTLPGNANQILKIHSLEGTSTIVPANYHEGLFRSFEGAGIPSRLRKSYLPFEPGEIRLSELAGVRYVAAEGTQAPYMANPLLRTVLEGLAVRPEDKDRIRFLTLEGDTRLALVQTLNEGLTFSLRVPDVERLDFAVGFEGRGGPGDSLKFLLMVDGGGNRVEFTQDFDLAEDGYRWHEASLDISGVSPGVAKGAIGVISATGEASSVGAAGWTGMDMVFGDCVVDTIPEGYRIHTGGVREFVDLALRSKAREVPLRISTGSDQAITRWIAFPPHMPGRHLEVDLTRSSGGTITVESDSVFTLDEARTVHLGGIYPDYQLIHTSDMHIYENFAAVEKGILIDMSAVNSRDLDGRRVLGLADLDEIGALRCGRCRIVSYEPERVQLEVSADRDCYLLFQDMYYPGWKVHLDSAPARFVRADVGLRVVEIPGGDHTVVMEFRPGSLKVGLVMTCLGLLLTVVYAWRTKPSAKGDSTQEVRSL